MELHDYIHVLREEQRIKTKQLCFGLCADSTLRNYESGRRNISIFLVYRLLERLGAREGQLQYFLSTTEYSIWKMQMNIIDALYKRELSKADVLLSSIHTQKEWETGLLAQFQYRMRSYYDILTNKDPVCICESVKKALAQTVPNYDTEEWQTIPLSMEELDLLLDYYYFRGSSPEEYEGVIRYIQQRNAILPRKNHLLGKVIVLYIEAYCNRTPIEQWDVILRQRINYLIDELLVDFRTCNHSAYLYELLEYRSALLTDEFKKAENGNWLHALNGMFQDMHKSTKTQIMLSSYDICNVELLGDVIRRRRILLNMSQKELAQDICTVRTLKRIEDNITNPQREVGEALLQRLKLPKDYVKGIFLNQSIQVNNCLQMVQSAYKIRNFQEMDELLEKHFGDMPEMDEYTRKHLEWYRTEVDYHLGRTSWDQYFEQCKAYLNISWEQLLNSKERYLTYNEISCCLVLLRELPRNDIQAKQLLNVLLDETNKMLSGVQAWNYAAPLQTIIDNLQNYYGNMQNYDASNKWCATNLDIAYYTKNIRITQDTLYALWWNANQIKPGEVPQPTYLTDLADLINDINSELFFRRKFS